MLPTDNFTPRKVASTPFLFLTLDKDIETKKETDGNEISSWAVLGR